MKSHEIGVKNKAGKELTVTVEYYVANQGELKAEGMDAKETKAYCEAHYAAKEKRAAELKKKMQNEAEKNKSQ